MGQAISVNLRITAEHGGFHETSLQVSCSSGTWSVTVVLWAMKDTDVRV